MILNTYCDIVIVDNHFNAYYTYAQCGFYSFQGSILMQKIFRKYAIIIITVATLFILIANFYFTMHSVEAQQLKTFNVKINQVIHTLENNQMELSSINRNLNNEYLTRARIAAHMVTQNKEIYSSVKGLQNLTELLDIDELHITDSKGIVIYSSVVDYIGYDLHNGKQSSGFLSILESDNKNSFVIQSAQPNSIEGKEMQYVGVSRLDRSGIVQIGLTPTRQADAQKRNTYNYIFSKFPTDEGEEFFAVDCATSQVIGHSNGISEEDLKEYDKIIPSLLDCKNGNFLHLENGKTLYIVSKKYDNTLICASIPKNILFKSLGSSMFVIFLCLVFVEIILILLLDYLIKQKVVKGIHRILANLSKITEGDLDTIVDVGGNPEFIQLSTGINTMVNSITNSSDRLSKIIDMIEFPIAAFEYQNNMNRVFITSNLRELLKLSQKEMDFLCMDSELFFRTIQEIMKSPIEGEKDIFHSNNQQFIRIQLSIESDGYMGVVTDVTKDMLDKHRIQYENNHDQLTGLCRYKYFQCQALKILENLRPGMCCAFVMMDLDAFKSVNDTFGHDMGDKYLQSFANMMLNLPESHCIVARRSGDEFCMFIYNFHSKNEIIALLDSFWTSLNQNEIRLSPRETRTIHASGGFVYVDNFDSTIADFLNQADEALYKAKREQKGQFVEYLS